MPTNIVRARQERYERKQDKLYKQGTVDLNRLESVDTSMLRHCHTSAHTAIYTLLALALITQPIQTAAAENSAAKKQEKPNHRQASSTSPLPPRPVEPAAKPAAGAAVTTSATRLTSRLPQYNQCPALPVETSLMRAARPCIPTDELPQHYYVIHNVPLRKVKYFFFGEAHNNQTHHFLKTRAVSRLGSTGDPVFFEFKDREIRYPCQELGIEAKFNCSGWETKASIKKTAIIPSKMARLQFLRNSTQSLLTIQKQEQNLLANSPSASELIEKMKTIYQPLVEIWEKTAFLEDCEQAKSQLGTMARLIHDLKNSPNAHLFSYGDDFKKAVSDNLKNLAEKYKKLIEEVTLSSEEIKWLNKLLTQTAAEVKGNGRSFFFAGWEHLVPKRAGKDPAAHLDEIEPEDDQYKLRKDLEEFPHAILIPR
jgi:hypothetical protein